VTDYLEIQKTRFGPRLDYGVSTTPGATADIPPFSIQTLVENSIQHVVAQRPEGGRIDVAAARSESEVVIEVSDDGPGFEINLITPGRGLDMLLRRARVVSGPSASLHFERRPNGMVVRLRLPTP
jgi:LytS/YehU family sensor histidine kinase